MDDLKQISVRHAYRESVAVPATELSEQPDDLLITLATKAALAQLSDHLPYGVLVVGNDLRVWLRNRRATQFLSACDALTQQDQHSNCIDSQAQRRLEQRVRHVATLQTKEWCGAVMRLSRGPDKSDLQLSFTPLRLSVGAFRAIETPTCCIHVFDPIEQRSIAPQLLRELHGLTSAEANVAAALLRGLSIEVTAIELGVTINTIKTHLKHIFQKCEVRSQAELLQMLALGPRDAANPIDSSA